MYHLSIISWFSTNDISWSYLPMLIYHDNYLIGGIPTPLRNMKVKLDHHRNSWGKHKIHVPNHQPAIISPNRCTIHPSQPRLHNLRWALHAAAQRFQFLLLDLSPTNGPFFLFATFLGKYMGKLWKHIRKLWENIGKYIRNIWETMGKYMGTRTHTHIYIIYIIIYNIYIYITTGWWYIFCLRNTNCENLAMDHSSAVGDGWRFGNCEQPRRGKKNWVGIIRLSSPN